MIHEKIQSEEEARRTAELKLFEFFKSPSYVLAKPSRPIKNTRSKEDR